NRRLELTTQCGRDTHPKRAARTALELVKCFARFAEIVQSTAGALEVQGTFFREGHTARRAVQQLGAQLVFQMLDLLGNGGGGQSEVTRCTNKALLTSYGQEYRYAGY